MLVAQARELKQTFAKLQPDTKETEKITGSPDLADPIFFESSTSLHLVMRTGLMVNPRQTCAFAQSLLYLQHLEVP